MKYIIVIIISIMIFSVSSYSQWIVKENHSELSQLVPEIRDIKIFPGDDLIVVACKNNSIKLFEYYSGNFIKEIKATGLTFQNYEAKISNDGKTTVFVDNDTLITYKRVIKYYLADNSNGSILCEYTLDSIDYYYESPEKLFTYFDYIYDSNKLILFINYYYDANYAGEYVKSNNGLLLFGNVNNKTFNIGKKIEDNAVSSVLRNNNESEFLISTVMDYFHGYSSVMSEYMRSSILKMDYSGTIKDTILNYYYSIDSKFGSGSEPGYDVETGTDLRIYNIYSSYIPGTLNLNISNNLIKFDVNNKTVTDSISKIFDTSNDVLSIEGNYLFKIVQNSFQIKPVQSEKPLYSFLADTLLLLKTPIVDFDKKEVFLVDKAGKIIRLKPGLMTELDSSGFYWNREWIYEGMQIDFYATSNLPNCTYVWYINDEIVASDNVKKFSYTFDKPGIYNVSLKVIKPDGNEVTFDKKAVINVLEKLVADFDFKILNDTLPLKVEFINKSKGKFDRFEWKVGNYSGSFDPKNKNIYQFKHPGIFSIGLKIMDDYTSNECTKYDTISIGVAKPIINDNENLLYHKRTKGYFGNAFFSKEGIYFYYWRDYDKSQSEAVMEIFVNNYNSNSRKLDTSIFEVNLSTFSKWNHNCIYSFPGDRLIAATNFNELNITIYDINLKSKIQSALIQPWSMTEVIKITKDNKLFSIGNKRVTLSEPDMQLSQISFLKLKNDYYNQYFADIINDGLHVVGKLNDTTYDYYSISKNNEETFYRRFYLNKKYNIINIKTYDDNNIILYGSFYNDKYKNNFGVFVNFNPFTNQMYDSITYHRNKITKIIDLNSKYFAAIGESEGRQGYLLLDRDLKLINDIRIDSAFGTVREIITNMKNIFIFTDKTTYSETMALGEFNGILLSGYKLNLPDEVIADIEDEFISDLNKINISPNPATDFITINPGNKGLKPFAETDEQVEIYNSFGELVMQDIQNLSDVGYLKRIDVSHLSAGLYFIKIGDKVEKFVKM